MIAHGALQRHRAYQSIEASAIRFPTRFLTRHPPLNGGASKLKGALNIRYVKKLFGLVKHFNRLQFWQSWNHGTSQQLHKMHILKNANRWLQNTDQTMHKSKSKQAGQTILPDNKYGSRLETNLLSYNNRQFKESNDIAIKAFNRLELRWCWRGQLALDNGSGMQSQPEFKKKQYNKFPYCVLFLNVYDIYYKIHCFLQIAWDHHRFKLDCAFRLKNMCVFCVESVGLTKCEVKLFPNRKY